MDDSFPGCRIDWHKEGAYFQLTRPDKFNTITTAILDSLSHCLDEIERRRSRWLVVSGEGERAFCAGADLAEAGSMSPDEIDIKNERARTLFFQLSNSSAISVAAINGLAYGGGLELAMACTFRISARHALFSLPEVKLGVLPSYGGTQFLPAIIGYARALDLMLTGRSVNAEEALAMGLISRIASSETPLVDQARDLGALVTGYSQVAIGGIRRCVAASGSMVTTDGLAVEGVQAKSTLRSADAGEGVRAFLEKRAPVFRHI